MSELLKRVYTHYIGNKDYLLGWYHALDYKNGELMGRDKQIECVLERYRDR